MGGDGMGLFVCRATDLTAAAVVARIDSTRTQLTRAADDVDNDDAAKQGFRFRSTSYRVRAREIRAAPKGHAATHAVWVREGLIGGAAPCGA